MGFYCIGFRVIAQERKTQNIGNGLKSEEKGLLVLYIVTPTPYVVKHLEPVPNVMCSMIPWLYTIVWVIPPYSNCYHNG